VVFKRYRRILLLAVLLMAGFVSMAQLRIDRYLETGKRQLAGREFSQALETFSQIIRVQDDNWQALYFRGLTKFYLGDERGAEKDFDSAIKLQPALGELYLYRGIVRDYKGDHYGALEDFNKGIQIKPDDPMLLYSRGTTYLRLNNYSRSIIDFDKAIDKNPRMDEAFLNRGIARAKLMDRKGAFLDFNEAIMLNPFSGDGQQKKGLLHYETGNYTEALVSFSESLQKDPDNPHTLYARALTWYESDRKDSCLADLNRVIKLEPRNGAAIYNRALVKAQLEDYHGAIEDYQQVNILYPNHVLTYFNRGLLWFQLKEYNGALADLSEAIKLYPDFAKAYQARAAVYQAIGKDKEAQNDLMAANDKVISNRNRTKEDLALNYADTTVHFEELISLNSEFMKTFSSLAAESNEEEFDPIGFIKINKEGYLVKPDGNRIEQYMQIKVNAGCPDFEPARLKASENLEKTLDLAGEKNFNEAIDLLSGNINDDSLIGPSLFARAIIRFDMIEFVMQTGDLNEVVPLRMEEDRDAGSGDFIGQVDYSEVEDDYSRLIDICPENIVAWFNRGLIRLYSRDFKGAESDMSAAVELDEQFAEAWYNRAIIRLYADEKGVIIEGKKVDACLDLSRAGELGIENAYKIINRVCGSAN
jgi:tetratricopeptide (TPR) repeat protein